MSDASSVLPTPAVPAVRAPLGVTLFVILVFFAADHDMRYSARYEEIRLSPAEWIVSRVEEGYLPRRIALMALGGFALASLVLFQRQAPSERGPRTPKWPLLLFVCLAATSVLWATDRPLAFRRVVQFLLLFLGAVTVARRYGIRDLVVLAFWGSSIYLAIGIACEIALGHFTPFVGSYRFCGTLHPNHQGWNCFLALASASYLLRTSKQARVPLLAVALVAFVFLVLTKSRTAFGCAMVALLMPWGLSASPMRKFYSVLWVIMIFCSLLLVAGDVGRPELQRAAMLGRGDAESNYTLTGRIPIWRESMRYIADRPFHGYGFNSFWSEEHILDISWNLEGSVPKAHNGYIELLLGVGIPGLVLFMIVLGQATRRFWKRYRSRPDPAGAFALSMVVFYGLTMLTEVIAFAVSLPTLVVFVLFLMNPGQFGHAEPEEHARAA